jgi:hypothetical protein
MCTPFVTPTAKCATDATTTATVASTTASRLALALHPLASSVLGTANGLRLVHSSPRLPLSHEEARTLVARHVRRGLRALRFASQRRDSRPRRQRGHRTHGLLPGHSVCSWLRLRTWIAFRIQMPSHSRRMRRSTSRALLGSRMRDALSLSAVHAKPLLRRHRMLVE